MWKLPWRRTSRKPLTSSRRTPRLQIESLESRCLPSAVIHVGATQSIQTLAQAATVAQSGDTVDIDAGTYTGSGILAAWTQSNITIEGVGGTVKLDATGLDIPNRKGIFVISGTNVTVKNIEFDNAHDLHGFDKNWAGIREQGTNLTVLNCQFFNNDDGILADANTSSDIAVRYSTFANNGYGDGYSHNMYIGHVNSFTLEYSYSHDANQGHDVKSRANTNIIRYNTLGDFGSGTSGYELSMPNGGTAYVVGNVIRQSGNSSNSTILDWGSEGASNPSQGVYLVNNTLVNDRGAGTFINFFGQSASSVLVENNIFAGAGLGGSTIYSGPTATQTTNLNAANPGFVNASQFDYHLSAGSAAINAGTAPPTVNAFNLTPTMQYLATANGQARPVVGALDIGAFEYGSAPVNQPPTVASAAHVVSSTNTAVSLAVLGADDGGEANLKYTWAISGPAGVSFSVNASNAAKNTTATFSHAGSYTFTVTITDAAGLSTTSSVNVTVGQVLSTLAVTPASVTVKAGSTQAFAASGRDQFGDADSVSVSWSIDAGGVGTIAASGLYTAPTSGSGAATIRATSGSISATAAVTVQANAVIGNGTGLTGQYFSDTTLTNLAVTRTDATVNFTWPNDTAPVTGLPADNWSVRWTGQVQAQYSETYTFYTTSDDGVRLWVNNQLLIDNWTYHGATENSASIALTAGQSYAIKMEFFEGTGAATAQLRWSSASTAKQVVPTSQLYVAAATLPAGWSDVDIGSPGKAGSASFVNGTWTVQGGGSDIWNTADQLNYVSQSVNGDATLVARIGSQSNTDGWAKAGVMWRDGTATNAMFADVVVTPSNGIAFQWRSSTGGSAFDFHVTGVTAPQWVKLVRAGNTFTAYYGSDGVNWQQLGTTQTIAMNPSARAGLAVTAHNNALLGSATFTNVGLTLVNNATGFTGTGLALNGSARLSGSTLRLTDGGGTEAGSAFTTATVPTSSFTTSFDFRITNPQADGFAFVMQNVGATALGGTGGYLGYAGIGSSIAIKFDLYNNAGEGANSTGLFVNGQAPFTGGVAPTTGATNLTGTGIDLHSGDLFNATITYLSGMLTVRITDKTTGAAATQTYAIDLGSILGANAFVGFTAGTGGLSATQDILNWTYTVS